MRKHIKYEDLSGDIKREIELFYDACQKKDRDLRFEDAMMMWFDDKFEQWMIDRCSSDIDQDKRKNIRFEIEVPIRVVETLVESSLDEDEALNMIGTIVNISRGGLYFKSRESLRKSSIVRIEIDLSSVDSELTCIEALAMVVRIDELGGGENGIGVMISSIYDDHRDHLDLFVFKNLAYYVYQEKDPSTE